jgi:hypothetical protein
MELEEASFSSTGMRVAHRCMSIDCREAACLQRLLHSDWKSRRSLKFFKKYIF